MFIARPLGERVPDPRCRGEEIAGTQKISARPLGIFPTDPSRFTIHLQVKLPDRMGMLGNLKADGAHCSPRCTSSGTASSGAKAANPASKLFGLKYLMCSVRFDTFSDKTANPANRDFDTLAPV
jgi:hypothetical protein